MNPDLFKNYDINTPTWSLKDKTMWARIVDMYDADTLTLILPLEFGFFKFSCRVFGIDTTEIKSKIEENKLSAHKAKNRMLQLCGLTNIQLDTIYSRKDVQKLLNSNIYLLYIKCREWDKYGRLLIDVYNNNINLATILIDEQLAYPYFGGTKLTEDEQTKKII